MLFSGTTTLAKLLQIRPAVVELLEATGRPFWPHLDLSLEVFLHDAGINPTEFIKKAIHLPVPNANAKFDQEPLYRLLDYLTANHREFQAKDLPEIDHLLDVHNIPSYPDSYVIRLVYQAFKPFQETFQEHMLEEENHVFPRILWLEACVRTPTLQPFLHRGSVGIFAAAQNHTTEEEIKRMVVDIREKVRNQRVQETTTTVIQDLYERLEKFERRLSVHAALETDILFPRAVEIEKDLLDLKFHGQESSFSFNPPH
jgi:regulator of cell morphogenesis and NO signaling